VIARLLIEIVKAMEDYTVHRIRIVSLSMMGIGKTENMTD
jgi:hypothetical protein